eukprot:CAMPEP_0115097666 /NCGR_PEP_ID=MMETSP0227-20121206/30632_1 /TAXON_ID=89957 /ORGANISM="Polarella glacialis, Strain CCMP 1383" /LENGTH=130 /DNA_ID=CAMNT_0002491989 /DNA_START=540 /DNA_END=928 /DNA_ORIENTATION=-
MTVRDCPGGRAGRGFESASGAENPTVRVSGSLEEEEAAAAGGAVADEDEEDAAAGGGLAPADLAPLPGSLPGHQRLKNSWPRSFRGRTSIDQTLLAAASWGDSLEAGGSTSETVGGAAAGSTAAGGASLA